jgi:hypothetical protein
LFSTSAGLSDHRSDQQTQGTLKITNGQIPRPKNEVKYLGVHLDRRLTWAKHIKGKRKRLNQKSETNALDTWKKLNTSNRTQTPPMQNSAQPHVDLWNSAMGDSLQFKHRNPSALSIQDSDPF